MPQRGKHENSLANLKMGSTSRSQGKRRVTVTLLPETIAWLDASGNRSERIDLMVRKILRGELVHKRADD